MMDSVLTTLTKRRLPANRRSAQRRISFETLESRNLLAVMIDVGYHLLEPNTPGQTVAVAVKSTSPSDPPVGSFSLRAQIGTSGVGPVFEAVRFAGDLWNTFPHVESGSPWPSNRSLLSGEVAFTQGFEAVANGTLARFVIDTTGIPAGSYEFFVTGTSLGNSSLRRANQEVVPAIVGSGTIQVRSLWQNPHNPNDINGDNRISPIDLLLLVNRLSKYGSAPLEMPSPGNEPPPYYDVDGDGRITPSDAVRLVNCLNGLGCVYTPTPIFAQTPPIQPLIGDDSANVKESLPPTDQSPPSVPTTDDGYIPPADPTDAAMPPMDDGYIPPELEPDVAWQDSVDGHFIPLLADPLYSFLGSRLDGALRAEGEGGVLATPLADDTANVIAQPAISQFGLRRTAIAVDRVFTDLADEDHGIVADEALIALGLTECLLDA